MATSKDLSIKAATDTDTHNSSCNMLTDKYLKLQATYFRLLGFNIFAYSGSWVYPYRTIYCIMSVLTFMPLTVAFCLQNVQNVDRLTDGLCSILIGLLGMSKFILVIWLHKDFKQLIEGIRSILIHGKIMLLEFSIIL